VCFRFNMKFVNAAAARLFKKSANKSRAAKEELEPTTNDPSSNSDESNSSDSGDSASTAESDKSWNRLSETKRTHLRRSGWNRKAWDKDDPRLMDFYNENEYMWKQLPKHRLEYWRERGYDAAKWNNESDDQHDSLEGKGDPRLPVVRTVALKKLLKLNLDYYATLDKTMVRLREGQSTTDTEHPVSPDYVSLATFVNDIIREQHSTDYYIQAEDSDPDQLDLHRTVGDIVCKEIHQALKQDEIVGPAAGLFGPFHKEVFSWSLWIGAKGTLTPMHFDTDLFNFLYLVEGRKRVVLVPNNGFDVDNFPLVKVYSGSAWTGMDILSVPIEQLNIEGAMEIFLEAGQGLCIPQRWWHAVENLEDTVAYGFRVVE